MSPSAGEEELRDCCRPYMYSTGGKKPYSINLILVKPSVCFRPAVQSAPGLHCVHRWRGYARQPSAPSGVAFSSRSS